MTAEQMVNMLKVDLGITSTAYDERLQQYIETAGAEIEREGAHIDPDRIDHSNLVIMYAAWMWRKRDTGEGMPRMIRYALNNLVFSQKMDTESEEVQDDG